MYASPHLCMCVCLRVCACVSVCVTCAAGLCPGGGLGVCVLSLLDPAEEPFDLLVVVGPLRDDADRRVQLGLLGPRVVALERAGRTGS